jgi:homoserine acetyltransferase
MNKDQYPYNLSGNHIRLSGDYAIALDCGIVLDDYAVAYETYGTLNADKSNAIMVFHALTGDQYVASQNPITGKGGWWSQIVGSNKPIDTDKYFVICANVLGGCMGSEGPKSINAKTNGGVCRFRLLPLVIWFGCRLPCWIIWGLKYCTLPLVVPWVGCRRCI